MPKVIAQEWKLCLKVQTKDLKPPRMERYPYLMTILPVDKRLDEVFVLSS